MIQERAHGTAGPKVVLLQHVKNNPGIRYRELLRMTGFVNGVLTYHLATLEKTALIRVDRRQSGVTRYYPTSISDEESAILRHVRQDPRRRILTFILEHDLCTFSELVEHTARAPSTVSFHLKRLGEDGVITVRHGEYKLYRLANRELVAGVLSKYRSSFVDRVVGNYVEALEEL